MEQKALEADPGGPADGHRQDIVFIRVNDEKVEIHRGRQLVRTIKSKGNVPSADVLEQVVDGRLVPLDDDGAVVLKGGEEFHSHPRDSGSSSVPNEA